MSTETKTEKRYGVVFGQGSQPGIDNFHLDKDPEERLFAFGWADGCPNPLKVAKAYGPEWTRQRYLECNFWSTWILERVRAAKPELADQLLTPVLRPEGERARGFDPDRVPDSHPNQISPMATPWGYALPRVLIEQLGRDWRENWMTDSDQLTERTKKGLRMVDRAIEESLTPVELIASLARQAIRADAPPMAVLGHIFAIEFKEEGVVSLAKQVAEKIKEQAPDFWRLYEELGPQAKERAGILLNISLSE